MPADPMEGVEFSGQHPFEGDRPAGIPDRFTDAAGGTITGSLEIDAGPATSESSMGMRKTTAHQSSNSEASLARPGSGGVKFSTALHGRVSNAAEGNSTSPKRKRAERDEMERSGKRQKTSTQQNDDDARSSIQKGDRGVASGGQHGYESQESRDVPVDEGEGSGDPKADGEISNFQRGNGSEEAGTHQIVESEEADARFRDQDADAVQEALVGVEGSAEAAGSASPGRVQKAGAWSEDEDGRLDGGHQGRDSDGAAPLADSAASSLVDDNDDAYDDDDKFLHVLTTTIMATRKLRQIQAERRKNLTEQKELRELIDFTRPLLDNAPIMGTDKYRKAREKFTADMARYERHLTRRQEALPELDTQIEELLLVVEGVKADLVDFSNDLHESTLPQCLKDTIHFQHAYARCRLSSASLKAIELELGEVEHRRMAAYRRLHDHTRKLAVRWKIRERTAAQRAGPGEQAAAPRYLIGEEETDTKKVRELVSRHEKLRKDRDDAIAIFRWRKELLARFAERPLVAANIISPSESVSGAPMAEVEKEEQDALNDDAARVAQRFSQGSEPNEEPEETMTEEKTLRAELVAAQDHYYKSLDDFNARRKLTEDEIAQLPHPESDREKGVALFAKGERTTKAFKDAEQRVRAAEDAARAARILDRYPIQQT